MADEDGEGIWLSAEPWYRHSEDRVIGPVPEKLELVFANELYIPKDALTPSLRNRILRLAAFQNPEFYRAQSMRLSTYGETIPEGQEWVDNTVDRAAIGAFAERQFAPNPSQFQQSSQ